MVLSRGLVISLGVSALGCTLLFLYFRNKISAVERKVDVMFDLIQNHQQQNSMERPQYNEVIHEEQQQQQQQQQQQTQGAWAEESHRERNLIDISDEDTDNDSEEVSDSESDEEDEDEEQPKISLARVENISLELADVKKITVKESDKVQVDDNIELEEVEDSLDEIDDDDDEDEDGDEEEIKKVTKTVTVVKEELDEEFDYTKLKVSELKAIAEQKGLEGYKSLKKSPLIELLKASE